MARTMILKDNKAKQHEANQETMVTEVKLLAMKYANTKQLKDIMPHGLRRYSMKDKAQLQKTKSRPSSLRSSVTLARRLTSNNKKVTAVNTKSSYTR